MNTITISITMNSSRLDTRQFNNIVFKALEDLQVQIKYTDRKNIETDEVYYGVECKIEAIIE